MFKIVRIDLHERAAVLVRGRPRFGLGPGTHVLLGLAVEVRRYDTFGLLANLPPEVRAVLPEGWTAEAVIGVDERGVLFRDGHPMRFLRPGHQRYWTVDPGVELRVYALDEPAPELTDALRALIPREELVETTVTEAQRGLLYRKGRFEGILDPGRYAFWSRTSAPVWVHVVDLRRRALTVAGQELMTRDKVSLRLSLHVDWAPADPVVVSHVAKDPEAALYALVQLAVREHVAAVTLDELLQGREALQRFLEERLRAQAEALGVRVVALGVRDIILPGEMRELLNQVIAAEMEAAANVIRRRDEAAATRGLANAAKVMAEEPTLLRLKELEALQAFADSVRDVKVVLGTDGLERLLPALGRGDASEP
ncbi:MAG: slipin family protein [Sandaracinaceae bacterium]